MKPKKETIYLAMKLHPGTLKISGIEMPSVTLPPGCVGLILAFKTKTAACKFMGIDTKLKEMEIIKVETKK